MEYKKTNDSGFTLLELLVGLAISCFVLVAAYSFILAGIKSYDRTKKNTEIQQEMQFIENIIGDAVENGSESKSEVDFTSITNVVQFNTGYQLLYYDKSTNKLALYDLDSSTGLPVETPDAANIDNHLVSKYVESFDVTYVYTELTTDDSGNLVEEMTTDDISYSYPGTTSLVKVRVKVDMKGKTDSSAKQYKFRNS